MSLSTICSILRSLDRLKVQYRNDDTDKAEGYMWRWLARLKPDTATETYSPYLEAYYSDSNDVHEPITMPF